MAEQLIDFKNLLSALMEMASEVEDVYKTNLGDSGHSTTEYALIDSVKTSVHIGDDGYEVIMNLNDYWKYVEWDTKPHFPPPSAIMRWITIKPIFPRPLRSGRIPTTRQLAFLIGRKISLEGTKGSHDLENAKNAVIPKYEKRIADALGEDIGNYLRKVMGRRTANG